MNNLALATDNYADIVQRLNRASVNKHFDAYEDINWDGVGSIIDPDDSRWERQTDDPLGATDWYQNQSQSTRARLGLALIACQMKMGIEFESILSRGLLDFAMTRPNGSADFRYAYHEIIEEGQHSLMFQEFVNRSGIDAPGMGAFMRWTARSVPPLGRKFPELFSSMSSAVSCPSITSSAVSSARAKLFTRSFEEILQAHVTEEARHVCFAQHYLEAHVPELSAARRLRIAVMTPFVLRETARLMLRPASSVLRKFQVPASVVSEAYDGPIYRALVCDGLKPLRETCAELGILTPATLPLWRALGVSPSREPEKALPSRELRLLSR